MKTNKEQLEQKLTGFNAKNPPMTPGEASNREERRYMAAMKKKKKRMYVQWVD